MPQLLAAAVCPSVWPTSHPQPCEAGWGETVLFLGSQCGVESFALEIPLGDRKLGENKPRKD